MFSIKDTLVVLGSARYNLFCVITGVFFQRRLVDKSSNAVLMRISVTYKNPC